MKPDKLQSQPTPKARPRTRTSRVQRPPAPTLPQAVQTIEATLDAMEQNVAMLRRMFRELAVLPGDGDAMDWKAEEQKLDALVREGNHLAHTLVFNWLMPNLGLIRTQFQKRLALYKDLEKTWALSAVEPASPSLSPTVHADPVPTA